MSDFATQIDDEFDAMTDESQQWSDDESDAESTGEQGDDDLSFSFDEPSQADKELENLRAELADLRQQKVQWQQQNQPEAPFLRERPTMFEHDYDDEAFNADLDEWLKEKAEYEQAMQAHYAKYQAVDERYVASVQKLRAVAQDYDDVENVVIQHFDVQKQALLKMAVDDTARLVYVLGKSPNKLAELAKLDEISFIKQIALLENTMLTRKANKPAPKEHHLTGVAGGGDMQLAKLEAEALRTGDRSKLVAYRKALKNKG